ncbi:hypothetical protein ANN_01564 [Periplaneta americana]|uniref:DUF4817 domain-containing protein n=1 Tax=Periplaneta americana TaxID=6978 RepID=A0ABQ8TVP8_PERAM|nr:hypothetical protein ANN_01564 [Periplaneta americana]
MQELGRQLSSCDSLGVLRGAEHGAPVVASPRSTGGPRSAMRFSGTLLAPTSRSVRCERWLQKGATGDWLAEFAKTVMAADDDQIFCCHANLESLPSKETLRGHSDSSFRGEGYIQCCVGVRLCDMYSNQELAEIHFMYGKADGNAALARRLYQERYPQRQCPDRKTFVRLHYRLCEYGKFNSPGLGRGRPRSSTPEVQDEILEAVNMTPSICQCSSYDCLETVERVSIGSLSFATCTGPVTSRLPCTS